MIYTACKKKDRQYLSRQKGNAVFERGKIGGACPSQEKRLDITSDSRHMKKARYQKHQPGTGVAWLREKTVFFGHSQTRAAYQSIPKTSFPPLSLPFASAIARKKRRQQPKRRTQNIKKKSTHRFELRIAPGPRARPRVERHRAEEVVRAQAHAEREEEVREGVGLGFCGWEGE
jgi:hypothetical protein